jgi:hypothetical protein
MVQDGVEIGDPPLEKHEHELPAVPQQPNPSLKTQRNR